MILQKHKNKLKEIFSSLRISLNASTVIFMDDENCHLAVLYKDRLSLKDNFGLKNDPMYLAIGYCVYNEIPYEIYPKYNNKEEIPDLMDLTYLGHALGKCDSGMHTDDSKGTINAVGWQDKLYQVTYEPSRIIFSDFAGKLPDKVLKVLGYCVFHNITYFHANTPRKR